eukprot:CAMPEP_0177743302 /NCGR_PEP_ID=MMETSP0484_2-20121128/29127_1 /TAXON_ID=354590 /ORGANISM="Rhodomonas lens, Strain RHODO" /LENGTH=65 /DNA_ID=CAMNT_0019257703 /DNA_START=375 /DNA_END=572 /DNA_ORIENTATION=+
MQLHVASVAVQRAAIGVSDEPLDGESLFSGRSSVSAVLSDADIGLHLHTLPLEEWALGRAWSGRA